MPNYVCTSCEWEGPDPQTAFLESPEMKTTAVTMCPRCYKKAIPATPDQMYFGHWYIFGVYKVKWE